MKKLIILTGLIAIIIFASYGLLTSSKVTDAKITAQSEQIIQLSPDAERLLQKNGFVVIPSKSHNDMNEVYKAFRSANLPIFVTTDSILHTSHKLFDYMLRITEVNHFMNNLKLLTRSLIETFLDDYRLTENAVIREAIHSNIVFFSVAARLLDKEAVIPTDINDEVEAELRLILEHEGLKNSAVFGYLEDYSQYVPRGHYSRSEELKSYFRAMMWYGRIGFYLNPSKSLQITDDLTKKLTRQALLIIRALSKTKIKEETAFRIWESIYEPTTFFVGKTDDLDVYDYRDAAIKIYGKIPGVNDLADKLKIEKFMSEARSLQKPQILSTFVVDTEGDKDVTIGFRFMGQKFIPDSYMFQNLVYPNVKSYSGNSRPFTWVMSQRGPIRGFPRGLDIMAVMGSVYAEDTIKAEGDSNYEKYNEQLGKLKKEFDLKKEEWSSNLYWSWLYCLKPLLSPFQGNAPAFMNSRAWSGKMLNTALGSWTELRHDTVLYAKESYTMKAGGMPSQPQLTHGYVEPYPAVFARVRGMTEKMRNGLSSRGLLDKRIQDKLKQYEKLLDSLETIARKELGAELLTENEYKVIWNIGTTLESVTRLPHDIMSGITSSTDDKMALISDVHTDPNSGQVLEEAVGFPYIIYIRVINEGKDQIVQGPVFSYYEFRQPVSERLTDEQWQKMLKEDEEPSLPEWVNEFTVKHTVKN